MQFSAASMFFVARALIGRPLCPSSFPSSVQKVRPSAELVCVHDSARPLLVQYGAAVLGVPVKQTIKEVGRSQALHLHIVSLLLQADRCGDSGT
jgi:hypothetical protein